MSNLHMLPGCSFPEHLAPVFKWPAVGGPLNGERNNDQRCDFERLIQDMRTAWDWAQANHVAVISVDADRNGAYLRVAPSPRLRVLFGDECVRVQDDVRNGLRTEIWLGGIEHIRVFWREVTCVH